MAACSWPASRGSAAAIASCWRKPQQLRAGWAAEPSRPECTGDDFPRRHSDDPADDSGAAYHAARPDEASRRQQVRMRARPREVRRSPVWRAVVVKVLPRPRPAIELSGEQDAGRACCYCATPLTSGAVSAGISYGSIGVHVVDIEVYACPYAPTVHTLVASAACAPRCTQTSVRAGEQGTNAERTVRSGTHERPGGCQERFLGPGRRHGTPRRRCRRSRGRDRRHQGVVRRARQCCSQQCRRPRALGSASNEDGVLTQSAGT
ncbi:hypothetical protein M2163_000894 [Streptomyces sp. SAI-135]|nr:hypothetical protein [Streptomyces sp. SAI-090]MDH6554219.1 hypothetical protein [Streptomyces sp. SAI-041]MDH6581783.1 hypothetical protein [Streptomyces sp. SAI-133]MDH6613786.1 hypothetical protein [Streptomyces sp. SAI-135]